MRSTNLAICLVAVVVASGNPVQAQDMKFGEFEFQNSCAACHGASGKGDGPVTDFLSGAEVSDLTVLQRNNGGVFPVTAVYKLIDGSEVASAHGTRDMPIWGDRFRQRAAEGGDPQFMGRSVEDFTQVRILALVEYLASIQEE